MHKNIHKIVIQRCVGSRNTWYAISYHKEGIEWVLEDTGEYLRFVKGTLYEPESNQKYSTRHAALGALVQYAEDNDLYVYRTEFPTTYHMYRYSLTKKPAKGTNIHTPKKDRKTQPLRLLTRLDVDEVLHG